MSNGSLIGIDESVTYLENTEYEFEYQKIQFKTFKTQIYNKLQLKYNKKNYYEYNFI
jgi:hypothetical protein